MDVVYLPSKDSGQAIPRVVESCIRYINLYGELLVMVCTQFVTLVTARQKTVSALFVESSS